MRHALWILWLLVLVAGCGSPELADRMAGEHVGDEPVPSGGAALEPARPVTASEVVYGDVGGSPLRGYAARPEADPSPSAGLVVIHEWWGLNDNIRAMTRRLAGEGYRALAVDLYGGQVAEDRDTAYGLMQESMQKSHDENLRQALSWLRDEQGVARVGTIGWCFGGGWSLNTALMFTDRIDATVIYYGRVETDPQRLEPLTAPILGLFAGQDQAITVDTVRSFEQVLRSMGKSVEVHIYQEADHAFANPSGTRYEPEAAADAWRRTVAFLAERLEP